MPSLSQCWFTATRSSGQQARPQIVSKPWEQVKCGTCLMGPSVFSKQTACHRGYSFLAVGISCTQFPVTKIPQKAVCDQHEVFFSHNWRNMGSNAGSPPMLRDLARRERAGDSCLVSTRLCWASCTCQFWCLMASQSGKYNYSHWFTDSPGLSWVEIPGLSNVRACVFSTWPHCLLSVILGILLTLLTDLDSFQSLLLAGNKYLIKYISWLS